MGVQHGAETVPPHGTPCLNCGSPLAGAWCSTCGQKWAPVDPTWHDLVHEAIHEFLHLDGKIFRTLRLLVTQPGALTAEHLRGRRAPYIGPLRLYLTMSVVYFLLSAVIPNVDLNVDPGRSGRPASIASAESPSGTDFTSRLVAGRRAALARPEAFAADLTHAFPKLVFALVPVFALALQIAFRTLRRHYAAFLYFSLHLHAALFAFLSLAVPLQAFASDLVLTAADVVILAGTFTYLVFALKRVFGGTPGATIGRATIASVIQGSAFAVSVALLVVFQLYRLGVGAGVH